MNDNVKIVIRPNGTVDHVKEVTLKTTTMSAFYSEFEAIAPKTTCSPILPRGTICHARNTEGRDTNEWVTMFFASQKITISFRRMSAQSTEENITNYEIAIPHMLIRQSFINGRINEMFIGVTKKVPEYMQDPVHLFRMPNIFDDGRVCIPLEGTPGDIVKTCQANVDLFFGGAPFSDDLTAFPPGISSFSDWQRKTQANARFIMDIDIPYMCKLESFVKGKYRD